MANTLRKLVVGIACAPAILFAQDPVTKTGVGDLLLKPSTITITGDFEASLGPTTLELALRAIERQIDQKRAAEAAQSPLEPLFFWKSPIWRFLPADPGGTLNSPVGALPDNLARTPLHLDDPFFTPAYLTLQSQHQDVALAASERRALWFFGH
jgi:hypothetical protein